MQMSIHLQHEILIVQLLYTQVTLWIVMKERGIVPIEAQGGGSNRLTQVKLSSSVNHVKRSSPIRKTSNF